MVFILNYLPYIVVATIMAFAYKKCRKPGANVPEILAKSVIVSILAFFFVYSTTNAFIPKKRSSEVGIPAPEFSETDKPVENRLRSPALDSKASEEKVKEISDWRKDKADREKKDEAPATP